jgi:glycosyltransferase involved in cell wall biosynthesis
MRISHLTIGIPAYNEEHRISSTLKRLREYLAAKADDYEVLVVDDGSTDAT